MGASQPLLPVVLPRFTILSLPTILRTAVKLTDSTPTTSGNASVDYLAVVGDIAYNAAQGSSNCFSGISIYQPQNHDTVAGTHIYVASRQFYSYGNIDPSPCQGGTPSDSEGIIFDTFDGSQGGLAPYTQQAVAYNNILLRNGGQGFETFNNKAGSAHATILRRVQHAVG